MTDSDGPAPGLVASTLLTTAEAHDRTLPMPVETGVASIDHQALGGGFRHGEITSIAGANGTGKTLVCFILISEQPQPQQGPIIKPVKLGSTKSMRSLIECLHLLLLKTDSPA